MGQGRSTPSSVLALVPGALALVLGLGALVLGAPTSGRADPPIAPDAAVEVVLEPPAGPVHVGDVLEIVAHVRLSSGARGPWMLAPTSDGPAVQVVRGRLLSIDADVIEDGADHVDARLRIPVLVRAMGTTVLRARVEAYGCSSGRCRPLHGEGALVIEVVPREPS